MIITELQLIAIMPKAKRLASTYVPLLNKFAEEFGVNTKLRWQHFLAQIALESNELQSTVENLNYSSDRLLAVFPRYFNAITAARYARQPQKIGNKIYADRMGNGSEQSGDGYKFRGRGLIQLTGKSLYQKYSEYCKVDLLQQPSLLEKPFGATRSAFWYFCKYADLLSYADRDDIMTITKKINGGYNGIIQRKEYLKRAKLVIK